MHGKYFSFGATSAVVTSLAVIVGFTGTVDAKASIISALLIIAIADNISDSFGIHVHQESQKESVKEVRKTTYSNFGIRLLVVGVFVLSAAFLSAPANLVFSIIFGLAIITYLSYHIAMEKKVPVSKVVLQHLLLTVLVMVGSFFLRKVITGLFGKFLY